MRTLQYSVVLLCAVVVAPALHAQSGSETLPPKAESVLNHIPAGCLGYVVVNNIKAATGNIDRFLKDTGAAELIFPGQEVAVLDLITATAELGEGFNPNGGFAVALLDPKPFGVDLLEMMKSDRPGPEGVAETPEPPVVLFVPATGAIGLFSNYEMEPAGKYTKVALGTKPTYTTKLGGYVVLSPSPKYLDVVGTASRKAPQELSRQHSEGIARADFAVHVNMKLAAPLIDQLLEKWETMMLQLQPSVGMGEAEHSLLGAVLPLYRDILRQIDVVTITGRFVDTGVILEEFISMQPDSKLGKMMGSFKPPAKGTLLSRLPNLPYVLAAGQSWEGMSEQAREFQIEMLDALLKVVPEDKLPQPTKDKIKKLTLDLYEQVDGMQLVIGGAPEGSGLVGMGWVMRCKDAEAVKAWLAESTPVFETTIKSLLKDTLRQEQTQVVRTEDGTELERRVVVDPLEQLTLRYEKRVETMGAIPVDLITISHPLLDEAPEHLVRQLGAILGEEKVRFRIAAPDKNTVVVALGGSHGFLQEALKAAKGTGTILTGKEVAEALKYMPDNRAALILLSGGNLFDLVEKYMKIPFTEGEPPPLPFRITTKTPIAIGVGISGPTEHVVLYVPKDLIREGVDAFKGFRAMTAPPPPMEGPEGF